MLHAVILLLIVRVAAPLVSLAAILLLVAYNMGEWHEFRRLSDFAIDYRILVAATFLLTVTVSLKTAVEVGVVLAGLFFICRITSLTRIEPAALPALRQSLPPRLATYSISGSLFFASVGNMQSIIKSESLPARTLVLELHQVI